MTGEEDFNVGLVMLVSVIIPLILVLVILAPFGVFFLFLNLLLFVYIFLYFIATVSALVTSLFMIYRLKKIGSISCDEEKKKISGYRYITLAALMIKVSILVILLVVVPATIALTASMIGAFVVFFLIFPVVLIFWAVSILCLIFLVLGVMKISQARAPEFEKTKFKASDKLFLVALGLSIGEVIPQIGLIFFIASTIIILVGWFKVCSEKNGPSQYETMSDVEETEEQTY